ncbi:hypothetical protein MVES_001833 [Malassezia vespertilionis]|uniref:Ras modification protein ERF4 n=1 Tax=Malassezia vespertilionis TaxID=2020962 RepID=A0A2N1JD96_9BASI|nr:hypothetical protein MVES_001833 [Malassezia vespertilionis]
MADVTASPQLSAAGNRVGNISDTEQVLLGPYLQPQTSASTIVDMKAGVESIQMNLESGRAPPEMQVRISRVWNGEEICQFSTALPSQLQDFMDAAVFGRSMSDINMTLCDAASPWPNLLDNVLAALTFQLSPCILGTHYRRCMKRFYVQLDAMEKSLFAPARLHITPPSRTAFLFLAVQAHDIQLAY